MLRYSSFAIALLVGVITSSLDSRLFANPNHADVDAAMAVFGSDKSKAIQASAAQLYETGNTLVNDVYSKAQAGNAASLSPDTLRKAHTALARLRRAAEQLAVLREPASVDWSFRCDRLQTSLNEVIKAYTSTPPGQKFVQQCLVQLQKLAPAREKEVKKLTQMVQKKQWEAAEKEWYDFFDDHHEITVFCGPEVFKQTYFILDEVRIAIMAAMRQIRAKTALDLLTQQRRDNTPDFQTALTELASAGQSVGATGTMDVGGQALSGPALVTHFGEKWKAIHVQALRCRGLDWALKGLAAANSGPSTPTTDGRSPGEPIVREYEQFSSQMMEGLAGLVKADAARVAEGEVPNLYLAYVDAFANVAMRTANHQLMTLASPQLDLLAAKSPPFAQNVAAYRAATDDLLRWRRRAAEAATRARSDKMPAIAQRFRAATMSDEKYRGLFDPNNSTNPTATFLASAPEILPTAMQRLLTQDTTVAEIVGQGGNKPAIGRYQNRTYVTMRLGDVLAPQASLLKSDLMAGENSVPLTLLATIAIRTADAGDLAAVGGKISGTHLEGLITRFASLPPAASTIVALGSMPQETSQFDAVNQAVMRFDIAPLWGQHLYFFVEFPPPQVALASP